MTERTARLNTLRGLLRELGVFIPVGAREVVPAVWALLEDADSDLPEVRLETMAKELPVVGFLRTIPGIGLLTATALLCFIGDIHRFPSGRHLASYLGLTPRQFSTKPGSHLQAR
jgi:transposase